MLCGFTWRSDLCKLVLLRVVFIFLLSVHMMWWGTLHNSWTRASQSHDGANMSLINGGLTKLWMQAGSGAVNTGLHTDTRTMAAESHDDWTALTPHLYSAAPLIVPLLASILRLWLSVFSLGQLAETPVLVLFTWERCGSTPRYPLTELPRQSPWMSAQAAGQCPHSVPRDEPRLGGLSFTTLLFTHPRLVGKTGYA